MAVVGKGSVRMQVNGVTQVIFYVYYNPELKNNLLSIGQLQEKGLDILIQHGKCRMFSLLAAMIPKKSTCFKTESENESHIWHCWHGHLSYKGLETLFYKKMVNGLPSLKIPKKLCTKCLTGKQHRDSMLKKSIWRA